MEDEIKCLNEKLAAIGYFDCRFDLDEDGEVVFIYANGEDAFLVGNLPQAEQILDRLRDRAISQDLAYVLVKGQPVFKIKIFGVLGASERC